MQKNIYLQRVFSMLLSLLLVLSVFIPAVSAAGLLAEGTVEAEQTPSQFEAEEIRTVQQMINDTVAYYKNSNQVINSWESLVALWGAGEDLNNGSWKLPDWKTVDPALNATTGGTEHIRYIFGLLAMQQDPSNAWETKRNLYAELAAQQKNDAFGGMNKHVWAMLALDTGEKLGHDVGGWNADAKQQAVKHVLESQNEDGGFALFGTESDTDITGMTLLALSNYQDDQAVQTTIEKAKQYLKQRQLDLDSGGFNSAGKWGNGDNSNSLSAAVSGLVAVGENLDTDQWKVNGKSVINAFQNFQQSDGSFLWKGTVSNLAATEQALNALTSYETGVSVWHRIAEVAPDKEIQAPANTETTIENGKLYIQVKDAEGKLQPAKVEATEVTGGYMIVQIGEAGEPLDAMKGIELPAGKIKIVILNNDKPYSYFETASATIPDKEWSIKFSAPLLDDAANLTKVKVQNAAGETVKADVRIEENGKSLRVLPKENYEKGELYYITIADVLSESGVQLKKPIRKIFIVE